MSMMRHAGSARGASADELQDLRLDGDVERGGGLVGDEQLGVARQRHRDHHPLAHAARQLVRVGARPAASASAMPDLAEHLDRPVPGRLLGRPSGGADRLGDLVADGEHRVERRHRLLEDHGHGVAADVAHLVVRELQQVAAIEQDLAGHGAPRSFDEAHRRHRRDALAAARFADHPQRLTVPDLEADPVDGLDDAVLGEEVGLEAFDLKKILRRRRIGAVGPGSAGRVKSGESFQDGDGRGGGARTDVAGVSRPPSGADRARREGRHPGSSRRAR